MSIVGGVATSSVAVSVGWSRQQQAFFCFGVLTFAEDAHLPSLSSRTCPSPDPMEVVSQRAEKNPVSVRGVRFLRDVNSDAKSDVI